MGMLTVQVTQNTTFTLNASSLAGMLNPSVMVTVGGNPGTETEPNDTIATATPLLNGGTIGGALAANDVDFFAVNVPAGGSVRAETSDGMMGCAVDTVLTLVGPGGLALAQDDNSGATPCSLIDPANVAGATDLVAGTYYVVVSQQNAAALGAYTLDVTVTPATCGNDITEQNGGEQCDDNNTTAGDGCNATCQLEINPTVITAPGGTVTVNFNANTSLHVIQVNVPTAGQAIAVQTSDPGGTTCNNVDTTVNLGNSNFLAIGSKADGGPTGTAGACAAILYPADAFARNLDAGTYYVAVLAASGTGQVQVNVNVNNPVCGNGAFETLVEQCDDNNTANMDGCSSTCQLELTQTVTLPAASPIVVASSIATAGEFDAFQVTVNTETQLRVDTFAPSVASGNCTGTDTFIIVRDANRNLLGFDDEGGVGSCSRLDETSPGMRLPPGNYFVEVYEYFGQTIAAYEIRFESVPVPPMQIYDAEPNGTQMAAQSSGLTGAGSVTVQGRIAPDGDDDVFSFTVPAMSNLTLTARTHDVLSDPTACAAQNPVTDTRIFVEQAGLEVVQPGTVELANNDDANPQTNIWCSAVSNIPVPGGANGATYYLRVQGFGDAGFRAYFLTLTLQ
jgi:cysteine-rich repeat protein